MKENKIKNQELCHNCFTIRYEVKNKIDTEVIVATWILITNANQNTDFKNRLQISLQIQSKTLVYRCELHIKRKKTAAKILNSNSPKLLFLLFNFDLQKQNIQLSNC